jgi:superfamily II DNA or RNA helicase
LDLKLGYDSADEALTSFYVPVLGRAVRYDRSVGFFRASALSVAARGMSRFVAHGGTARFLIGADVTESDRDALIGAVEIPPEFAARLAHELVPEDEIARRRLEVLAWLVRDGRLEVRVAIAVDRDGVPVAGRDFVPYFHEKVGVLRDHRGDGVAFQGSVNESATAWMANFESFSVYRSWDASAPYFDNWTRRFEDRWAGSVPGFRVFPMPDAVRDELLRLAPPEPPPPRDPEETPARADRATLARFLAAAPRLVGSEQLAPATSGVRLFPHQRKVVERLAGSFPRSWLVADEVGLGKTISAGMSLRRLLLAGDVERALILAPANVCRQWQDELFERFGLWVPRYDGGRIWGAHPDDVEPVPARHNPYADHPILLVSSHLARKPAHRERILAAPRLDLLVVDEAHHARRRGADLDEYRPSQLLQLLDEATAAGHAGAVWLLTATPMQIHPVELLDLLRQVGLTGPLSDFGSFERFFAELAKTDDSSINWELLHRLLAQTPVLPYDAADEALLAAAQMRLGPVQRDRIARFSRPGSDAATLVDDLGADGRRELRAWIRHRSPVGQLVTRHSRATLKRYRSQGLLDESIADRDVAAVPVPFTPEEERLYKDLDGLLGRLMEAHGTKRGAGFVLTIYRRRLTSSWAAIRTTLRRRLDRQRLTLEDDLLDEVDDELDDGEAGATIDDAAAVPLTDVDLAEIKAYLDDLDQVADSKFDRLTADLNAARGGGQAIIVFTQFTDTLDYLRDRLHAAYRSHLATYTGDGGRIWLEDEGWTSVSKQELVDALRSGRVSVILATDAASEGLNLQAASHVINYDLPWNPMRVEQRIGRIDRIGQPAPVVRVRNYVIPGTIEEAVYQALAGRIDIFSGILGPLQPILGATEGAFGRIFRAPRSERAQVTSAAIADLLATVDQLESSGFDIGDEDPMPDPVYPEPPVTLAALHRCLAEELDIALDEPGRSVSADPTRVSRDPERWCALATYGHPRLHAALDAIATRPDSDAGVLVLRSDGGRSIAYRADRTPPQRVRTLTDLTDLGPALAAGEADEVAATELARQVEAIRRRRNELLAARRDQWERDVRQQFRHLVTRAVRAEQQLRLRDDGEAPEASLVWLNLTRDQQSGWQHADLLRQHLGVELADLLPRGGPGADERPSRELVKLRAETGRALVDLILKWREVALPGSPVT